MSNILTQCAAERCPFNRLIFRTVASKASNVTARYTDSDAEHEALENALYQAKPKALPTSPHHFPIRSAFRYPPLQHGSRFGKEREPSIFYGSLEQKTSLAERAYYALRFAGASEGLRDENTLITTLFSVKATTSNAVDLRTAVDGALAGEVAHPSSYRASQRIGAVFRQAEVPLILYPSARLHGGTNIAAFVIDVFSTKLKGELLYALDVHGGTASYLPLSTTATRHVFSKQDFEVNGVFPVVG